jgi:AcrR family transcriptional regulator
MFVSNMTVQFPEPSPGEPQASTRQALLDAAGKVFAEAGFRDATVRQICNLAEANVAAVNYHFGDKENLYLNVLRHAHRTVNSQFPLSKVDPSLPPEQRLRLYVEYFLKRLFLQGPDSWMAKIMSREMIEPTKALDVIVNEEIRPNADELSQIVAQLLGGEASPEAARLCSMSVVSQCLFYHHCRPVIGLLFPEMELNSNSIQPIADHITRFSLAGLKEFAPARSV